MDEAVVEALGPHLAARAEGGDFGRHALGVGEEGGDGFAAAGGVELPAVELAIEVVDGRLDGHHWAIASRSIDTVA
jgi:hypothetical protein